MSTFTLTLSLAIILVLLSLLGLGLSRLLTGKLSYKLGMCGKDPNKKMNKDNSCGKESSCSVCQKDDLEKDAPENDEKK